MVKHGFRHWFPSSDMLNYVKVWYLGDEDREVQEGHDGAISLPRVGTYQLQI